MADRNIILNSLQVTPAKPQADKKEQDKKDLFLQALRKKKEVVAVENDATANDVLSTSADMVATSDIPEVAETKDDKLIREYLQTDNPYYDEELLRGLSSQQLTDYIYEEEPALVEKHFPELFGQLSAAEVAEISGGAELLPYEPTMREKSQIAITNALVNTGAVDSKYAARSIAKGIVGDPTAENILSNLGLADLTPAGAAFAIQEASRDIKKLSATDAEAAEYILPALEVSLSVLEAIPVTKFVTKGVKGIVKGKKTAEQIEREKLEKVRDKYFGRKMRIGKAKAATDEEIAKRITAAEEVANKNKDIAEELILDFENRTGKTISSKNSEGRLVIDGDLARKAGKETAEEVAQANRGTVREFLMGDSSQTEAALLAGMGDEITQPILKPEKFDALVASIADLKKKYPDAFDNSKTTIDNLFELTVNKELIAGDELIDMLNKYNLSFEDYILTVVGSGSEAGRVLQKLSQIKRMRPTNEMVAMQEAATKEAQGKIRKNVMRIENIRRGGLVSQLATASRNLTSGGIRAPLEGLGNVMDTALYNLSEEGYGAAAKSLVSGAQWRDSFRHMKYMFGPETRLDVEDYVNFILDRPELSKQYDLMFNNLNEIQKMTGRGEGGALDATLSMLEDGVDVLNTPNRWQEYLIRRGAFLGELERLTKREYGIDLIDTINEGKIRDLLNDASTVKPANARSFNDIVADATDRALDITYAKQPDIPVFRSTSQFITRNGLTVVLPFPRFMFNSMELMGQYAGGASIPLTRKIASIVTRGKVGAGKLTAKDRQRIARNIQGIAVAGAAYQYRTSENAPSDYKQLRTADNTVMDVTPQYPMRQFMYIGEATKRLQDGTFNDWFKSKEFVETFVGTNIREGVGQSLIQEIADLSTGVDLTDEEQAGRILGRSLGNYLSTWAVPFAQIIEAERAAGVRGLEYKDTGEDPTLDFQTSFVQNLTRPFSRFESPEEEAARPKREFLFAEDKQRVMPILRVIGGINLATIDDEYGEYIGRFGYTDYELGSKSKIPSIRRFENEIVRDSLPLIVEAAKRHEEKLRKRYKSSSQKLKEEFTEEQYVSSRIRKLIKDKVVSVRNKANKGKSLFAKDPTYIESMMQYRRLKKETRQAAGVEFFDKYDREPDPLSAEDIKRLVLIGKAYDKAMK